MINIQGNRNFTRILGLQTLIDQERLICQLYELLQ